MRPKLLVCGSYCTSIFDICHNIKMHWLFLRTKTFPLNRKLYAKHLWRPEISLKWEFNSNQWNPFGEFQQNVCRIHFQFISIKCVVKLRMGSVEYSHSDERSFPPKYVWMNPFIERIYISLKTPTAIGTFSSTHRFWFEGSLLLLLLWSSRVRI